MLTNDAEVMRIKYKYRRLLMNGTIKLAHRNAARLIGPDCAYHLYATHKSDNEPIAAPSRTETENPLLTK